jgi:hypothetical protein
MKSTSSRFSFDMIGAAKQEKLLEERHRQREAEKKDGPSDPRDSRYDEFDEDGFDYDAMMEDDGLEERIPGVNADYEEEDFETSLDPDNDQENFSGFVFQRSNPQSALTSPQSAGMMETPRDADGKVIGFAMTKDTTPDLRVDSESPCLFPEQQGQLKSDPVAGLAIRCLDINGLKVTRDQEAFHQYQQMPPPAAMPKPSIFEQDDLYFDDGLAEFENEFDGDGVPFDESIFDNDDTDQYGRPIPGAFAQAAQLSRSINQDQSKRESDITSRLSAHSAVSHSTAHTSLSVGGPHLRSVDNTKRDESISPRNGIHAPIPGFPASEQEKVAAYQAALAAAAHQAAANGKFRRDSSPSPAEQTLPDDDPSHLGNDDGSNDYEDDPFSSGGLDEYELDDDDIAEANASALANDSDGWYGQEFGFYSAPVAQHPHPHHPAHSSNSSSGSSSRTNFEFANGGYFGPSGVSRTISGQMVSREPNLTPITERSEYSNRNSIMSLPVPLSGLGASGNLHSPGLAQLAMMADSSADDSNMTLSALLRLRSKAWGGSQASLVSSREGSPRSERGDGSNSPWGPGAGGFLGINHPIGGHGGHGGHGRKNSAFSVLSRDSDPGSISGSPTLTMSIPVVTSPPPPPLPTAGEKTASPNSSMAPNSMAPVPLFSPQPLPLSYNSGFPPVLEDEESRDFVSPSASLPPSMSNSGIWIKSSDTTTPWMKSPDTMTNTTPTSASVLSPAVTISPAATSSLSPVSAHKRPGMGHRHKGSADSISYVKEEESGGEIRWVKERRRVAETGEVEILEREVVEGGRI